MRKRPSILLPLVVGIVALLGFGWLWIAFEPDMSSQTSTIGWALSEISLALALAVPAVCLFFAIRAAHIRRLQAREAVGPAAAGIAKARDLLWSLTHELLPPTESPGSLPTDAREQVFLHGTVACARHSIPAPAMRSLVVSARGAGASGARQVASARRGWSEPDTAEVAATDRRILVRAGADLLDIRYADITDIAVEPGAVVLRLHEGAPILLTGEVAESLAVLAVWGSVGESALRRHPALASLRT
ncbi:hypothetical protein D9V29_10830 [Mycetocola manganoxydans]|uniref:Uncharacterized protein n=1 Tax=Mycetocola manganoxydans TaxID=699879 RepID=A0A3L6ZQQ7_9MICO|nr:hypothetical protein [Mycetocola manganoxydans]RLP70273.1 hypothetical protein D9V29_10830 [Mycetocola manganoxydans]GHD49643.1 hypothetical protein GCM10008097_22750 [Mycetocola manganoxydans]